MHEDRPRAAWTPPRAAREELQPRQRTAVARPAVEGHDPHAGRRDWSAKTAVAARRAAAASPRRAPRCPTTSRPTPSSRRCSQPGSRRCKTGKGIDWGSGEMLAMGSLLLEGTPVRFTGPGRRSAAPSATATPSCYDYNTGKPLHPARRTSSRASRPTSRSSTRCCRELAVLGFEYGFSSADPRNLVMLGSAVRRLRQRRPADHRPVHRRRREQVAAA